MNEQMLFLLNRAQKCLAEYGAESKAFLNLIEDLSVYPAADVWQAASEPVLKEIFSAGQPQESAEPVAPPVEAPAAPETVTITQAEWDIIQQKLELLAMFEAQYPVGQAHE
jgi:hypothetical protein